MWYPVSTSLLLASHDAWLEEMRKEPAEEISRPVRQRLRRGLGLRVSQWLISTGQRLQPRNRPEAPATPELPLSAPAS
jgi:hypothetical protein